MADFATSTYRPMIAASNHVVAAGHYLASQAAMGIFQAGGNAIDAGVAAGLCINTVQPDLTNLGGVAPIILYLAKTQEVITISGLGRWPRAARLEYFRDELGGTIPLGVQNAITPSACDAWLTALARYGTLSLTEVMAPAIELASKGFPVSRLLCHVLAGVVANIEQWPSSAAYLRGDGTPLRPGDMLRQPELAGTFEHLCAAERANSHLGRAAAIMAARDVFYKGDLAEKMARFSQEQGGFLDYEDLACFSVKIEPPAKASYRDYEIFSCGPWCQGPVVPQTMNILENFDLAGMGHNSPEALHVIIEALKASFADRHAFYGDPDFVSVPIDGLLDKRYAAEWAARIDLSRAWADMPEAGDPWRYSALTPRSRTRQPEPLAGAIGSDTSYLCVVDKEGNGFSATPSDGVRLSPIVPGVGTVLSPRGVQSWLDPEHPSSLAPGKRPRLTPSPGLALKEGKLAMVFGTPGLDVQPQAMVQLLVNTIDHGMDPQAAIEQPRVATYNFPASSHPHAYEPGKLCAEGRIPSATIAGLEGLGHRVTLWPDLIAAAGALCCIQADGPYGPRVGGADPRRTAYAMGW